MKIRVELPPARRRLISGVSAAVALGLWFALTAPVLPPLPPDMAQPPAAPAAEAAGAITADATRAGGTALPVGPQPPAMDVANPGSSAAAAEAEQGWRPIIPAMILPSPVAVLRALAYLHTDQALVRSAAYSFYRVTAGFLLAALVAIPLGIIMGAYTPIRAMVEPVSTPLRYLPISAVTGIFMLLFGIGDLMKIMFLFIGSVVYLLPIVVESVARVEQVYLDTAYTLGARPGQAVRRVLIPAAWPGIIEACRVIYGVGWTYVILAELVNAEYGLGHLITIAYKRAHIDWAYALVFVVLLLGIATNEAFRQAQRRLFAWREA